MPVQKFRTLEEADRALEMMQSTPKQLARRVDSLWKFSASLAPRQSFRGVRKYRSIEDANRDREGATSELFKTQ